jgi:hypothetical protein
VTSWSLPPPLFSPQRIRNAPKQGGDLSGNPLATAARHTQPEIEPEGA